MDRIQKQMEGAIRQTKILAINAFEFLERARTARVTKQDFLRFASKAQDALNKGIREVQPWAQNGD